MKWGVRRAEEELKYDRYSIETRVNSRLPKLKTPNGVVVKKISLHALERIESREDRKVSANDILDALKNPLVPPTRTVADDGRARMRFVGRTATVNVNPDSGVITTLWKTSSKKVKKLTGGR